MPNSVRYYESTMSGAPSLSGTAGALISVLDACLVDGFGSVTVDSLVVASNVVTATVSAGHQFAMVGNTGPVIRIAGASPSGLNGDWRVTVTSSTVFTFATSGIGDQTATGTISAKRAPAGFSKAFSGTNKAAYRADDVTGTRLYCRIDDSTTTYARIRGYEAMDNVDTVTSGYGVFPTDAQISGGGYVYKSSAASAATRAWTLFSDGRIIYFFCDAATGAQYVGGFLFGDIDSYQSPDAYNSLLLYSTTASGWSGLYAFNSTFGCVLARSYTQLGGSILSSRYSHGKAAQLGSGYQAYPAPVDNSVHVWPVECWESTTLARGMMPGLWNPLHNASLSQGQVVEDFPQLPGRTLVAQIIYNSGQQAMFDLTGPWR